MELAQEKGSSNWLTSLPLQEHNFTLHKVSEMPFHSGMVGYHQIIHQIVLVDQTSRLNMFYHAPKAAFPQFDIMRCEILLDHGCQKYAMMFV